MRVKYLAIIFVAAVVYVSVLGARSSASEPVEIQLFSAPDESSLLADSVKKGEVLSPMAETVGAGGIKWYLVQTKNRSVGWIKGGDSEESKKLESFFKSLPNERTFGVTIALPEPASGSLPPGTIVVKVETTGSSVIVPVTLNQSLKTYLILDTGATTTMVSSRIANSLGLRHVGYATGVTIGGPIRRPMARLPSLQVGDAEVRNLLVSIHDFRPIPQVEGLLGLDFLRQFHVSLDSRKQLLVLSPR